MPLSYCPYCAHNVDRALQASEDPDPRPGDIAVCAYCAKVSLYTEDFQLRKVSDDELAELHPQSRKELDFAVRIAQTRIAVHARRN